MSCDKEACPLRGVHPILQIKQLRLGDAAVTSVVRRFTGSDVTRFDPTIGVLLSKLLDSLVNSYDMGFWNSGPDQYVVHSFFHVLLIYCYPPTPNDTMLHGHLIALPTDDLTGTTSKDDEDNESDFDFKRNNANPPYPSYLIELAEARARQYLEDAERNHDIVSWNSGVSIS